MSRDRELLELAAKAAGYTLGRHSQNELTFTLGGVEWKPLEADGDVLRLARARRMTIAHEPSRGGWSVGAVVNGSFSWLAYDDDQRRAIVRAAAEIGRTMP